MSKVSRIQIDNSIIIDDDITHNAFGLYVLLKGLSYIKDDSRIVSCNIGKIKDIAGWKDNRTLRSHFGKLEQLKLITKAPKEYRVNSIVKVKFTDRVQAIGFTQVDRDTVCSIIELTKSIQSGKRCINMFGMALRLFYYYEKNYNQSYAKAFPSYEAIRRDTGISYNNIKQLNDYFDKNRIVIVSQGAFVDKENQFGEKSKSRQSNTYIPICNRRIV